MDATQFWADMMHRLGWTLIHSLWEGAVIAAMLAMALALIRRTTPQVRYIISVAALGATVVSVILTFQFVAPPARPTPVATSASGAQPALETLRASGAQSPVEMPIGQLDSPPPSVSNRTPPVATPPSERPIAAQPWYEILRGRIETFLPRLTLGWAIGILILSVWHLGGWIAVQRLRVLGVQSADTELQRLVAALARHLQVRKPVRVVQSLLAETPMVIGWLRPVILLPVSVVTGLSPDQLRGIIAHELAHVRRHDYLVNLLQVLVETTLFYHPAVWWVSRRIRLEREQCCDDIAVAICGDRYVYAESLTALEEVRLAGSVALAARGTGARELTVRIRRLVDLADGRLADGRLNRATAALAASCILLAALAAAACVNTAHSKPTSPVVAGESVTHPTFDNWTRMFPGGVRVDLLGVSVSPSDGRQWWLPNGSLLAHSPYPHLGASATPAADEVAREIAVRVISTEDRDVSVIWQFDPRCSFASASGIAGDMQGDTSRDAIVLHGAAAAFPRNRRDVTVRVGVASGEWKTIAETAGGATDESTNGPDPVTISHGGPNGGAFITAGRNVEGMQRRVIEVGLDGKEVRPASRPFTPIGSIRVPDDWEYQPAGLVNQQSARRYRLQVRPYAWAEFQHVTIAPSEKAATSPSADAHAHPHLGDVIDRLIESHGADNFALNLGSGDVIRSTATHPLDWRPEGIASLRAAKVDLFQPIIASSGYSLTGVDMRLLARFEPRVAGAPRTLESIGEAECRPLLEAGRRTPLPGPGDALVRTDGEGFYVFITRDGVEGVLQVVNWDGRFKLRYKQFKDLVTAALPAGPHTERPATLPLPPPNSDFSNTVYRTLPWHEPCRGQYLQFLTGRIVSIGEGPGDKADHAAEFRAIENGGADLSATPLEDGLQIAGHGCTFVRLPANNNTGFTVAALLKFYGQDPLPLADLTVMKKDLPCRVAFRTRTGEFGILRIVGIDDALHGVTLGYQLVERDKALPDSGTGAAPASRPASDAHVPAGGNSVQATVLIPEAVRAAVARSYPEATTQIQPVTRPDGSLAFRVDYQYRPNLRPMVFGMSTFQDGWAILNPEGYLIESSPWHTGTQGATTLPAPVIPGAGKAIVLGLPKLLIGMWDVRGDGLDGKELKIEIDQTGPLSVWLGKAGVVKIECTYRDEQIEFAGNHDVDGIKARGSWKLTWISSDELSVMGPDGKTFSLRRWTQPWPPDPRKKPATQAALPAGPALMVYEDKAVSFRFGVPNGWLPTDAANAGGPNRGAVAFGQPQVPSSTAPRIRATIEAYVQDVGTAASVEPVRVPQPHYTFFKNVTIDGAPGTVVGMLLPEESPGAPPLVETAVVTVAKSSRFF